MNRPIHALSESARNLSVPRDIKDIFERNNLRQGVEYAHDTVRSLGSFTSRNILAEETPLTVYVLATNKAHSLAGALHGLARSPIPVSPIVINGPKHDLQESETDPTEEIADIFKVTDVVNVESDELNYLRDCYAAMTQHMYDHQGESPLLITDAETVAPPTLAPNWLEFIKTQDSNESIIASGQVRFYEELLLRKNLTNAVRYLGSTAIMTLRNQFASKPDTMFQMNMLIAPNLEKRPAILRAIKDVAAKSTSTLQNDFELREAAVSAGAVEKINWSHDAAVFTDGYRFNNVRDVLRTIVQPEHRLTLHEQPNGQMFDRGQEAARG